MRKSKKNPMMNMNEAVKRGRPAHIVASQQKICTPEGMAIAVLAAALEPVVDEGRRELALLAVFSWSVGIFLYAGTGLFVAARMLLYPLRPDDLTPPYWVAMGATAITVVAGARIVQMADAPMVAATRGLAAGTVKRVFGTVNPDFSTPPGTARLRAFLETKTVWHPTGALSLGGGGGY